MPQKRDYICIGMCFFFMNENTCTSVLQWFFFIFNDTCIEWKSISMVIFLGANILPYFYILIKDRYIGGLING